MAWVDIALLSLLAVSVLLGVWRGLLFELLSILGWFVAYFSAPWVAPALLPLLPAHKLEPNLLAALAMVLGFLLVLVLWGLAAKLLRALLHATPLSVLDRLGGAAFGVLRGVLLGLLTVVLVGMTPAVRSEAWQGSQLAPWLQAGVQGLKPLLPASLHEYIPV